MTTTLPPCQIGDRLEDVDTPALLLDLDALERNLDKMAAFVEGSHVKLRAHAKNHKSPAIARMQVERGAVGVCCQKVGEAEVMVAGGIRNVMVTNQIVGMSKARRLAALATQAEVGVAADDPLNVEQYNAAAAEFGVTLPVLVEVNMGTNRCGVLPGEESLALAQKIAEASHLRFAGLQAYHGGVQHVRKFAERRERLLEGVAKVGDTRVLLEKHGLPCEIVTGGGTGTYPFEAASGVYTELQCGSYIFMDADYAQNLMEDGQRISDWEHSLFVYTTVMSRRAPDRAIVDAGLKALSVDQGPPVAFEPEGVEFLRAADEHGYLKVAGKDVPLQIGDKLRLIPGHCDPQVNLFDWYVGIRKGRVEALLPVAARGAVR